jgi:hypothetical protein
MDWAALVCEPAKEYLSCCELQRFGLNPYLPQSKRRYTAPRSTATLMRRYPLFVGYLLLPLDEARHSMIHEVRGLRYRPLLADDRGNPWRCPENIIEAIRAAEAKGDFDETALGRGDKVTLRRGVFAAIEATVGKSQSATTLQILLPLFGGARATVAQSQVMRA